MQPLKVMLLLIRWPVNFCLYFWKCVCWLVGHLVGTSVKLLRNLFLCPFRLLLSKCPGSEQCCSGDEGPPVDSGRRRRGRSGAMPGKRKRCGNQAAMPGRKGNTKKATRAPLEFVGGRPSRDSGQRKLEDFYGHAGKDGAKRDGGRAGARRLTSDRCQQRDSASLDGTSANLVPTGNRGRAPWNTPQPGPAENWDQPDSVLGSPDPSGVTSRRGTKSPAGQKRGPAEPTASRTRTADLPDDLPGTSGSGRVGEDDGRSTDDQGRILHRISDSESDASSDTQPVTPRKPTGPRLGSLFSSPRRPQERTTSSSSSWSARDMEAYRNGYPNKKDNMSLNDNWKFYNNELPSKPRGTYIDTMHQHWFGDYSLLEEHHGYIQWLFPIRERGMNWQSQELQLHEARRIRGNPKCSERVLKSYELMLHFWGMHLKDRQRGTIVRGSNWKERFRNLNRSSHNYLRITRVLKSLGELGHERLKTPFLKFVLHEAVAERTLANAERSCLQYWIHTLMDDGQRTWMRTYADNLIAEGKR